jgi:hypothetical protein
LNVIEVYTGLAIPKSGISCPTLGALPKIDIQQNAYSVKNGVDRIKSNERMGVAMNCSYTNDWHVDRFSISDHFCSPCLYRHVVEMDAE